MILKNYYKMVAAHNLGGGSALLVGPSGTNVSCYNNDGMNINMAKAASTKTGYTDNIRIGSGTTPATFNDYNLESHITSGFSASYSQISKTFTEEGAVWSVIHTITNTSSSPLTVGEIGCFAGIKTTSSGSYNAVMIDRTVLDTPVTIPVNGVAQITYTITFTYPTA